MTDPATSEPVRYDIDQARRVILSNQVKADCYEDRAAELREMADEWERQAHNFRVVVLRLADRLAQDGYRPPILSEAEGSAS